MLDYKAALRTLGWRTDTGDRTRQAVRDFQRAWNLGPALAADGIVGDKTLAALEESLARRAKGLPDISEHFNAVEFACECGKRKAGPYSDCRRIWTPAVVIDLAETWRTVVGPYTPARAGRCPRQNANVGGAPNSIHLSGYALDLPVYKVTVQSVIGMRLASGIGTYTYTVGGKRVTYVRHLDLRHLLGKTGTVSRPAQWAYPNPEKHTPMTPRPVKVKPGTPTSPAGKPGLPKGAYLSEDGIADAATLKAFGRMWGVKNPTGQWDEPLIKAMQGWAGVHKDGAIGPKTIHAVQRKVGAPLNPVWSYAWTSRPTGTTAYIERYYNRAVRNRGLPF